MFRWAVGYAEAKVKKGMVHVNRLKLYQERQSTEAPPLNEDDEFDPVSESLLDQTILKEEEEVPPEEIEVKNVESHRVTQLGKLQFRTNFADGSTSWQDEENFYEEDGTITEALDTYFKKKRKPSCAALQAQISKFKSLFKPPKYPFQTAINTLLNLIGKKSTKVQDQATKGWFNEEILM